MCDFHHSFQLLLTIRRKLLQCLGSGRRYLLVRRIPFHSLQSLPLFPLSSPLRFLFSSLCLLQLSPPVSSRPGRKDDHIGKLLGQKMVDEIDYFVPCILNFWCIFWQYLCSWCCTMPKMHLQHGKKCYTM